MSNEIKGLSDSPAPEQDPATQLGDRDFPPPEAFPLNPEPQAVENASMMNVRTRLGLGILIIAALMGVLGDSLLRETPWGVNVLIWTAAVVIGVLTLLRFTGVQIAAGGRALAIVVFVFASLMAWRDSATLKVLDGLVVVGALSMAAFRAHSGRVLPAGVTEYVQGLFIASYNAVFGPLVLLIDDIKWKEVPIKNRPRHFAAVARGLLIAVPLMLVFGGLFMAADAVFEGIVKNAFNFNFQSVVVHGFVITVCAWSVSGSLRAVLLEKQRALAAGNGNATTLTLGGEETAKQFSLGVVEVGTALALLDLLFLSFVAVQFKYFFGGAATIEATTELTYAEYARRGFFELVTVAMLALPMLLAAHWLLRKNDPKHERIFRLLAGAQIVLLFVIMFSALQRMRLYQIEYGLTELRFYTTAFMGWLAIVFVWFSATVLRGERRRFAFGALVAGAVMVVTLHVLNPDSLIVRTNVARANSGRGFDARYATSLSADAVPSLVAAMPSLSPQEQGVVAARLLQYWTPLEHEDWRASSRSRREAWRTIQQNGWMLWRTASWPGEGGLSYPIRYED